MNRGRVIPLSAIRGRVVPLGGHPPAAESETPAVIPDEAADLAPADEGRRLRYMLMLCAMLPMFGQVFHYMIDVGKVYYISKFWPLMVLPFGIYALFRLKTRFAGYYLACVAYVLCVTPVMSIVWLGNDFGDAITNSVKVWPLTYYFSLLGILVWFDIKNEELAVSLLILGGATAATMLALWYFTPWYYYTWDPLVSRLFLKDLSRGNHIFFPITFLLITTFYATYEVIRRPRVWHVLFIALSLYIQFAIFKQRTAVASCLVVMGGLFLFRLPRLVRSVTIGVGFTVAIMGSVYILTRLDQILLKFGGSLTVRQTSMGLLQKYLGDRPLRWVLGAGGASRMGSVTMEDIVGRKDFWLTDLGWAGVLFEFGVLGTLMMMTLFGVALWWTARQPAVGGPRERATIGAVVAYIAYLTISSVIYSFVYAPGELASMTALLLYMTCKTQTDEPLKATHRLM